MRHVKPVGSLILAVLLWRGEALLNAGYVLFELCDRDVARRYGLIQVCFTASGGARRDSSSAASSDCK